MKTYKWLRGSGEYHKEWEESIVGVTSEAIFYGNADQIELYEEPYPVHKINGEMYVFTFNADCDKIYAYQIAEWFSIARLARKEYALDMVPEYTLRWLKLRHNWIEWLKTKLRKYQ